MRRLLLLLLLVFALGAGAAFAQGLSLSGEAKTGIYWEKIEDPGKDPDEKVKIHSKDDAGNGEGRFRLNLDYINEQETLGFRARIQWESFTSPVESPAPGWSYAFGYGNFFNNQVTLSVGKLGGSPWGTGGPEMWKELEVGRSGGIRLEWKPSFIPEEYGKLNVGFVLNGPDSYTDAGMDRNPNLVDVLRESVIGLSYTHEFFMLRFAYRLDSEQDMRLRGTEGKEGDDIVYRIEEHALEKLLPGLSVWALGFIQGVGSDPDQPDFVEHKNWVFAQYAPENFTAQFRFCFEGSANRNFVILRPNFYYKFFGGLLEAGALFGYAQDFGAGKIYEGSPYSFIEVEPKVQVNFAPGAYAAFVYNYRMEYAARTDPAIRQAQWMNLRFGIYY